MAKKKLEKDGKRTLIVNPDEPKYGDFVIQFYNNTHPSFGNKTDIDAGRALLRGLSGKRVRVSAKFMKYDVEEDTWYGFTLSRKAVLRSYKTVFGPQSLYWEMFREAISRVSSDDICNVASISVELT